MAIGLAAGFAFVIAAGGSAALRRWLPHFRSAEVKRGAHQIATPLGVSGKLPLVGGLAAAVAAVVAAALLSAGPAASSAWWVLAGAAGFFLFGLADDLRKTRVGRGVPEGAYLVIALILSVGATALVVGPGAHESGAASPYALAHWLGTGAHVPLSVWYLALILGTTLATSFSDGMDGLTPGTVAIATAGAALAAGIAAGVGHAGWPLGVAAIAAGLLVWNLPSEWSPANRGANRRASIYIGDSGALMLGAASAAAAIVAGVDLLWPLIAAPLLLEGLSSLLQAKILVPLYRRWRDPRLSDGSPVPHQRFPLPLLASPLHYHWEIVGLNRQKIVLGFWAGTLATAGLCAIAAAMLESAWAALAIALAAAVGAAFWGVATWTRPAFVAADGDFLLLYHGRPISFLGWLLARRRRVVGDADAVRAAADGGLLDRPMNAHVLDATLEELLADDAKRLGT
ncbi:MAG: hypothetical protein OXG33_02205 [Chloroflexi bacterium]|nr:hypothetical protein [Chloroflexota bacterium]